MFVLGFLVKTPYGAAPSRTPNGEAAVLTKDTPLALTFDDVLLVPRASAVLPRDVDVRTRIAGIALAVPVLSSAMDTVTEHAMAIAMARQGGLGVLHKNMSPERQAEEVRKVKAAALGEGAGMVGAPTIDGDGRLRVAAAVGVGADRDARVAALVAAGVDVIIVDTAHGHSMGVLDAAKAVKDRFPDLAIVLGNVATAEATEACFKAGADAVKVGVGPGSICTTRIVAGTGVPQLSAVSDAATVARAWGRAIIADGGIRASGDVAKAIGAGADAVMVGSLLAGTDETPGELRAEGGRRFKVYRGMGSLPAMQAGSSDRYFQEKSAGVEKLVPEGVVARVKAKGPLAHALFQVVGGLRAAMGYSGCGSIAVMQAEAQFVRITPSGLAESHVHDVDMIEAAPNYSR